MQLFVVGMHRSGTSAVARVLNLMGCYFGPEGVAIPANPENPKGFWERQDVRQVNDAILRNVGADWDQVSQFDAARVGEDDRELYRDVIRQIVLDLDAYRPWFVKEPRFCLTFELWREHLETPVCVVVHRNPVDVARSLEKRNGMPIDVGLALWESYNVQALNATAGVKRMAVSYERLLKEPASVIAHMLAALRGHGYGFRQPADDELTTFLDGGLRHFDDGSLTALSPEQQGVFEALRTLERDHDASWGEPFSLSANSIAMLQEHEAALPSPARRAEDANATLIRHELVDAATELTLKRRELDEAYRRLHDAERALVRADEEREQLRADRSRLHGRIDEAHNARLRVQRELREAREERRKVDAETTRLHGRIDEAHNARVRAQRETERQAGVVERVREELSRFVAEAEGGLRRKDRELLAAVSANHALKEDAAALRAQASEQRAALSREKAARERERYAFRAEKTRELNALRGQMDRVAADARARVRRATAISDQYAARLDTLGEQVDLLLGSRRWRYASSLMAIPYWLLRRGSPSDVDHHLRHLIETPLPVVDQHVEPSAHHPEAAPASTPPRRGRAVSAPPVPARRNKRTTVLVLAWDVGHNPLGRAYLLAEALARTYTVVLAGFQFSRFGDAVWAPLRHAPFRTVAIPASSFPGFQTTLERLAPRLDPDVVIACKARLPAVQAALMCKAFRNRPVLIDVDDYELGFFGNQAPLEDLDAVEPATLVEPFEEAWTQYAETLLPHADGLIVSNLELKRRFGGVVVPHARDETAFDPGTVDRDSGRRLLALPPDVRIVLFVGTPRPHKGVLDVLKAVRAAKRDDFRLVVVGTPPDHPFENALRTAGGSTLVMLPDQPFDQLASITAQADLICLLQAPDSPIAQFQLPAKVVDAIALGIPVLATDVPPLRPLVAAGAVETVTLANLSARITAWLDAPDHVTAAQADRARSAFLQDYSYRAINETLCSEIDRVLASPKPLAPPAEAFLASQTERFAEVEVAKREGLDLVMFWKQGDVGIYGRRFDMLVQELARRTEIRRIAIFDAPFSAHQVLKEFEPDLPIQNQRLAERKLARRWGLADDEKVSHHVFLFDSHDLLPQDRYPRPNGYANFVQAELERAGIDPTVAVFWYYPILSEYDSLRKRFRPRLQVVDVVDDQRTWPGHTESALATMTAQYRQMVADADVALANCEEVRQAMSVPGSEVALVPNGCDTDPLPPFPDDEAFRHLCALPGPVVGLVGNLEGKTDLALLERLAQDRPDWHLALVGSAHTNVEILRLDEYPNVHFFGVVDYPDVKAWIKHFDVALLPHLDTPQTRRMHPLKLLVYMSVGVPVVSTRIENLGDFEPFINVAESHDQFLAMLDNVMAGDVTVDADALAATVARNAWSRRVDNIMALVNGALRER